MKKTALSAALLIFLAPLVSFSGNAKAFEASYTGVWNDPSRSGEGFTLEVLNEHSASFAWFTFDEAGNPRWAYSLGEIMRDEAGVTIQFADIYRSTGGAFGPAYEPGAITSERVGEASLTFADCNHAIFSFDAFGQSLSLPVQRLTQAMGAGCGPIHGRPGEVIQPYVGQTGIWSDPARFGQGFQLQWTVDNAAVLGWYTFGPDGEPYWLTGLGRLDGEPTADGHSRVVFDTMYSVHGARFGSDFNAADVELRAWGEVVLELECGGGTVLFDSEIDGFGSGSREIQLLTRAVPFDCPWATPKLGDLYDLEYTELPIPAAEVIDERLREYPIRPVAIADDETVVAIEDTRSTENARILRLSPGGEQWEPLADAFRGYEALITPDGANVYARELKGAFDASPILRWSDVEGWQPLSPPSEYEREIPISLSHDGERLVGRGFYAADSASHAWKWSAQDGAVELPVSEEIRGGTPLAISNNGQTVVGYTIRPINGFGVQAAIRWSGESAPQLLMDADGNELGAAAACDAECRYVFGFGWVGMSADPSEPKSAQPWYWVSPTHSAYLGMVADSIPGTKFTVSDVSEDGTIVVGSYSTTIDSPTPRTEGWLWTQNTGIIGLRELLLEYELDERWSDRAIVSMTSDGSKILIAGWDEMGPLPVKFRAAILRLVPKAVGTTDAFTSEK